jgi:N-methylhydantoinase A
VIVPRHPGVGAALGLLLSDVRHDLRRSWLRSTSEITPDELETELALLEDQARDLLAQSGHDASSSSIAFELDMRFHGQAYNLTVPLPERPVTGEGLRRAVEAFEELHRSLYAYTPAIAQTQIVTLRAQASGSVGSTDWQDAAPPPVDAAAVPLRREVWQHGAWQDFTVVARGDLRAGAAIDGPTIIEQDDTTVLVPAGWRGTVHPSGAIRLAREAS